LIQDVKTVFHNSAYNAVKLQLYFYKIWEGSSFEEKNVFEKFFSSSSFSSSSFSSSSNSLEYLLTIENKREYYALDVYNVNIDKNPLITITYKSIDKIKDFIIYMLKDLQMKSSENGENNHRVITIYKLQVFLCNVSKNTGGKIVMKSITLILMVNQSFILTLV
jgi:hypothetical protein